MDKLCARSLSAVRPLAAQKGQSVAYAIDPPDLTVRGDADAIAQVLQQLLSNAVKFTPDGGRIGLEVGRTPGGAVRLAVWDTGIGIDPALHAQIFQPFVQVDRRLARQYEGVGLGLAIVQRTLEQIGGSITVDSTPGAGSRFTVTLA